MQWNYINVVCPSWLQYSIFLNFSCAVFCCQSDSMASVQHKQTILQLMSCVVLGCITEITYLARLRVSRVLCITGLRNNINVKYLFCIQTVGLIIYIGLASHLSACLCDNMLGQLAIVPSHLLMRVHFSWSYC